MLGEFAKRLKHLMELEGISKRALSIKIGIDRSSIRLWLSGVFYPKYDALIRLAEFFNVSIDGLLGLESLDLGSSDGSVRKAISKEEAQRSFLLRLKNYMDEKGLTRYAMAKKIGVDPKALNNWFTKGSMPEVGVLIRLAEETKMSVDELLGWEDKNKG